MPTSHMHQLNEIIEVILWTNPQTMLDVGVGFGKYGVLAREYLELRDGREQHRSHWQQTDWAAFSPHCFIPDDFSLICLLGADTALVRQTIRHPRRRISQSLPFLKRPYRTMKRLFSHSR